MYDPEFNLWVEGAIRQIYVATDNIRNMTDENHPLAKLCESYDNALGVIEQMCDDYNNCFDEAERKVMSRDIRQSINDLIDLWGKLEKVVSKNQESV